MRSGALGTPREAARRLGATLVANSRVVVVGLTLLTLGLGFIRLDYRALYVDEAISMGRARESWGSIWDTVTGEDPNMSLYYLLLKSWTAIVGHSWFAVRSLSVLFAALTVPVVYAIGKRLFGTSAGLVAALLLATNAFFLRYAQEARAYSLVALLVALSSYFFLLELDRPGRRTRAAYAVTCVLAFHAHFFAVWVILAQVVVLLATRRRAAFTAGWLVTYGTVALLTAPMAYAALTLGHDPIAWIAEPGWWAIRDALAQLAGDSFRQIYAVVLLCLLALPLALRSPRLRFGLAFTGAWVALPVVAAFAISQLKPIWVSKYLIVSLPGLTLLTAGAIASFRRTAVTAVAVVVLVVFTGPPLRAWYRSGGFEDWRSLAAFVDARARPGDAIAFNAPYGLDSFQRFSAGAAMPERLVPPGSDEAVSSTDAQRVWLALAPAQFSTPSLRAGLEATYRRRLAARFPGDVIIELYELRNG